MDAGLKVSGVLWGSWAQLFSVPHCFDYRKQPSSASMTFPELQWADSNSYWSGKRGETREQQTGKSSLGARSCFPIKGYTWLYLWAIFSDTETPSRWEKLMIKDGMLPTLLVAQTVKNPPASAGDTGSIPGSGRPLEKGMATHSSIPALRTSWTEEPGGLPSRSRKSQTRLSD